MKATPQGEVTREDRPVIGWREWLTIPSLGSARIKAKVDTGARSSALHAFDVEEFEHEGEKWVRFKVHPDQRDTTRTVEGQGRLLDHRTVRCSEGTETLRPVVLTTIELLGQSWEIELTLVRRDNMGFRMLLGRQGVRRRFVVDSGRSFVGGKPRKKRRVKKPKRKSS